MTIGIILLTQNNIYLTNQLDLPRRPSWDKKFLTDLVRGKKVVCSKKTLDTLPKSILDTAYFTTNTEIDYDINLGIDTFKNIVDLLFVVRSKDESTGKVFRLDDYNLILKKGDLEIWTQK